MSLMTYNFNGKKMRTVFDSSGNAWFSLDDVVEVLEYKNITEIRHTLESLDMASFGIPITNPKGFAQERKMVAINESGLYTAILKSGKPEVKTFKIWIITEVLPSIRKAWANTIRH